MILTDAGRGWAQAHADESIEARIALGGYGSHWPCGYVNDAITACNRAGESDGWKVTRALSAVPNPGAIQPRAEQGGTT